MSPITEQEVVSLAGIGRVEGLSLVPRGAGTGFYGGAVPADGGLVLDLMLPDIDGYQVCRQIREQSDVPIIILTARRAEQHLMQGLLTGADDYITKPFSVDELLARISTVLRRARAREQRGRPATLRLGDLLIDLAGHRVTRADQENVNTGQTEAWDPTHQLATVKQGAYEVWEIRNGGGGWVHPMHLHQEEHRVVMRNGKMVPDRQDSRHVDDVSKEDVIALDPGESVVICREFRDFVGKYVAHCHNLAHEDHAMMFGWEIVP